MSAPLPPSIIKLLGGSGPAARPVGDGTGGGGGGGGGALNGSLIGATGSFSGLGCGGAGCGVGGSSSSRGHVGSNSLDSQSGLLDELASGALEELMEHEGDMGISGSGRGGDGGGASMTVQPNPHATSGGVQARMPPGPSPSAAVAARTSSATASTSGSGAGARAASAPAADPAVSGAGKRSTAPPAAGGLPSAADGASTAAAAAAAPPLSSSTKPVTPPATAATTSAATPDGPPNKIAAAGGGGGGGGSASTAGSSASMTATTKSPTGAPLPQPDAAASAPLALAAAPSAAKADSAAAATAASAAIADSDPATARGAAAPPAPPAAISGGSSASSAAPSPPLSLSACSSTSAASFSTQGPSDGSNPQTGPADGKDGGAARAPTGSTAAGTADGSSLSASTPGAASAGEPAASAASAALPSSGGPAAAAGGGDGGGGSDGQRGMACGACSAEAAASSSASAPAADAPESTTASAAAATAETSGADTAAGANATDGASNGVAPAAPESAAASGGGTGDSSVGKDGTPSGGPAATGLPAGVPPSGVPFDPRFQRGAPKTPPRKKCEHCAALNPTARQFCVSCGARFNIKQKNRDRDGRKRSANANGSASGASGASGSSSASLPPLPVGGGKAGGGSGGGAGAGGGADGADVGSSGGGSAAAARGVNGAAGADSASGEDCKDGGGGPDGGDAKGRGGEGVANSKAARTDDGEGKGGPSSADGGGSRGGRRNGAGLSTKTCPACGHVNQLSRLSCMLCAAKFSVKQTAQLLQQRHMGDAQGGTTRYAELETGLDPDLEANGSVDPSSAEISANAFKLLPEEAQIQVMQEKAAHRLLAQTLHQQMLEELHTNPALAADPEQQLQFKRLAQQQLLYQMALAAQAAAPPQNERNGRRGDGDGTDAAFEQMLDGHLGTLDQAAWALGEGDEESGGGYGRGGGDYEDEGGYGEGYGLVRQRSYADQLADFVESDDFGGGHHHSVPDGFPFPDTADFGGMGGPGRHGRGGKPRNAGLSGDFDLGYPDDFDPLGPQGSYSRGGGGGRGGGRRASGGDFFGDGYGGGGMGGGRGGGGHYGVGSGQKGRGGGGVKSGGKAAGMSHAGSSDNLSSGYKRVRLVLAGCARASPKAKKAKADRQKDVHRAAGELDVRGGASGGAMEVGGAGSSGRSHGSTGDLASMAGEPPRQPPKRRAWLSEKEAEAALHEVKFPPSAASARLLKQLADFNPSGSGDSARNALLPNEHDAKERGEAWRLPEGGCPADLLRAAQQHAEAEGRGEGCPDGADGGMHEPGLMVVGGAEAGHDPYDDDPKGAGLMPPPVGLPRSRSNDMHMLKNSTQPFRRDISMCAADALIGMDMGGGSQSPRKVAVDGRGGSAREDAGDGACHSALAPDSSAFAPSAAASAASPGLTIPTDAASLGKDPMLGLGSSHLSSLPGSANGSRGDSPHPLLPDVDSGGFKGSLGVSPLGSPRCALGVDTLLGTESSALTPLPAAARGMGVGSVGHAAPADELLPMPAEEGDRQVASDDVTMGDADQGADADKGAMAMEVV